MTELGVNGKVRVFFMRAGRENRMSEDTRRISLWGNGSHLAYLEREVHYRWQMREGGENLECQNLGFIQ